MKKLFFLTLIFGICFNFYSQENIFENKSEFSSKLNIEILEKLKNNGSIQNIFLNDQKVEFALLPNSDVCKKATIQWTEKQNPRMTSEKLFYVEKTNKSQNIELVSKIIRSISTMKGTEYYSNRHKKWETLYHDAYLIKSKTEKIAVADDVEGSANGKKLYCFQKDNSFGNCYYELNYIQTENEVSVFFDNFESLKFGPITAAKPHNVKINLVILDEGDYFLAYMVVQAYYPNISILEEKMIDSFNSRVDSIFNWFESNLNK